MNKVWPTDSPLETYRYYDFPLGCPPAIQTPQLMSIGQILKGDRIVNSLYDFPAIPEHMKKTVSTDDYILKTGPTKVCERVLTTTDVELLQNMIAKMYQTELYIDEFPVSEFIGMRLPVESGKSWLEQWEVARQGQTQNEPVDDSVNEYLSERMWSEYHSELYFNEAEQENKNTIYWYFLVTHYIFEVSHFEGEVRQARWLLPALSQMTNITDIPRAGGKSISFSYEVRWTPSTSGYPDKEQAVDLQIDANNWHLQHDLNPEADDDKENQNWTWADLPDTGK